MKKTLILLLPLLLIFACGKKDNPTPADSEVTKISVEEFFQKASSLTDKKVEVTGLIVHTCRHSGKRAHIVGKDAEKKLKLELVGDAPKFDKEMEGKTVVAEGTVKALIIDEAYLAKWESEIKAAGQSEKNLHEGHQKDHEQMNEQEENLAKIAAYRKELAESKAGKLEFYSVDCNKYKIQ